MVDRIRSADVDVRKLGKLQSVAIGRLRLDANNPRLPASAQGQRQNRIAEIMEMAFEAFPVAESICRHGFFPSEPLIAMVDPDDPEAFIVLEGNRRLTALLGLGDPTVRAGFASPERWNVLAAEHHFPMSYEVPVVVVRDRASCAPFLGFRHISGILGWTPLAQARYVTSLIDDGRDFGDVAEMIGKKVSEVRDLYRNYAICVQAKTLGLDTSGIEHQFSLLTVAMNTSKIREYVGAPVGIQDHKGVAPLLEEKRSELKEVIGWVFGIEDKAPVIRDSRQIVKLGGVISSPEGLRELRKSRNLEQALQAAKDGKADPRESLKLHLRTASNVAKQIAEKLSDYLEDPEIQDLAQSVMAEFRAVEAILEP
jgi:hypothetical protein